MLHNVASALITNNFPISSNLLILLLKGWMLLQTDFKDATNSFSDVIKKSMCSVLPFIYQ